VVFIPAPTTTLTCLSWWQDLSSEDRRHQVGELNRPAHRPALRLAVAWKRRGLYPRNLPIVFPLQDLLQNARDRAASTRLANQQRATGVGGLEHAIDALRGTPCRVSANWPVARPREPAAGERHRCLSRRRNAGKRPGLSSPRPNCLTIPEHGRSTGAGLSCSWNSAGCICSTSSPRRLQLRALARFHYLSRNQ